jgi:hypothetical protein
MEVDRFHPVNAYLPAPLQKQVLRVGFPLICTLRGNQVWLGPQVSSESNVLEPHHPVRVTVTDTFLPSQSDHRNEQGEVPHCLTGREVSQVPHANEGKKKNISMKVLIFSTSGQKHPSPPVPFSPFSYPLSFSLFQQFLFKNKSDQK